ncbi:MAG TPA: CehA/McbA family metallohydrolase [Candidatus Saccharimonadales bacterium]|nr:CehA/McbA family metallohydrolase [Candidatus Saccharimonadales bacterium]
MKRILSIWLLLSTTILAAQVPVLEELELQPFVAQVNRLVEAFNLLGESLPEQVQAALRTSSELKDAKTAARQIQQVLDPHCLFVVSVNPEMRVKVAQGPAKPELVAEGWRQFLVKVLNESGASSALKLESPNAKALSGSPQSDVENRWLDATMFDKAPLKPALSGLPVEYRIVQLFSRVAGKREARFSFNIGQGTQDLGFRNETDVLFTCVPGYPLKLRVLDENGEPTTASFIIRDAAGRIYPPQSKRLAPDFSFHPQVYRHDGETIHLPAGSFKVEFSRGPESLTKQSNFTVSSKTKELPFKVERWIDPSKMGWWSGDHHIHAAGCAHYVKPTEGVLAEDMIRHVMGEDLKVGANLTWGPCFDYQKQFFCGSIDKVSQYPYLLRYDIEVSGFGSHQSGHLCLLRLKEQMYPGGESKDHWPTLCLNTLRWAKKQGALCGPAHSGWGLAVKGNELPNYSMPKFDGIGANEYIVDVTHDVPGPDGKLVPAVDFLSMVDTPSTWELNIWYHTLNAGFRTRVSGETDFPCIYGEKVGLGRSYVKLDGKLEYNEWCENIRKGRNYVSDGKSHLMNFRVNDAVMGENGSELRLDKPGSVRATVTVAAMLPENPLYDAASLNVDQKPYWDIERARVSGSHNVPVELLVNGKAVARKELPADGKLRDISFDATLDRSSWVAIRILPSSHTNPIFVLLDGKPIRPSRRSLEWCLKAVDQCWSQKQKLIRPAELADAREAYAHARTVYKSRLDEASFE